MPREIRQERFSSVVPLDKKRFNCFTAGTKELRFLRLWTGSSRRLFQEVQSLYFKCVLGIWNKLGVSWGIRWGPLDRADLNFWLCPVVNKSTMDKSLLSRIKRPSNVRNLQQNSHLSSKLLVLTLKSCFNWIKLRTKCFFRVMQEMFKRCSIELERPLD